MKKIGSISLAMLMLVSVFFAAPQEAQANSQRDDVVRIATQLTTQNIPYEWGGTTTRGFDCSGFVQFVYRQAGISILRTTGEQITQGTFVNRSNLRPGDIVFFNTENPNASTPTHNGIYIGNNRMAHSGSSRGVEITSFGSGSYWGRYYIGARRIIQDAPPRSSFPALPVGQYHDVPAGFWAHNEIRNISIQGHMNGTGHSFFDPNDQITRASVAAVITRMKGLDKRNNHGFNDVRSGHWATGYIGAVEAAGYMNGNGNGAFQPDRAMTRAEVSAVFRRAFDFGNGSQTRTFSDVQGHWAYDDIHWMASNGITIGNTDGTFHPNRAITRAEFAVFLHRALEK